MLCWPTNGQSAPPYVTEIPHGYRDWKWISSAHEAGKLDSLGAVLGNDVVFNAFLPGWQASVPGRHDHCRLAAVPAPVMDSV